MEIDFKVLAEGLATSAEQIVFSAADAAIEAAKTELSKVQTAIRIGRKILASREYKGGE